MNLETSATWIERLLPWAMWTTVGTVLLVVGLAVLRRWPALRSHPRWLYGLGLLLLLRLWMPVLPPLQWRVWPAATAQLPVAVPLRSHAMPQSFPSEVQNLTEQNDAVALPLELAAEAPPLIEPAPTPALIAPQPERKFPLWAWLCLLWGTGVTLLLGMAWWRQVRFAHRVQRLAQPASAEVAGMLAELQILTSQRQAIRLAILPGLSAPAVFGWWRPQILLTESAVAELHPSELRHVLLHELMHLRHHDVLMNWLLIFTKALHWFNPLVWLGFRWLVRDREMVRDLQAISFLETSQAHRDYGHTLLKLALGKFSDPATPSLTPFFRSQPELQRRIVMITQATTQHTSRWQLTLAFIALAGLALVSLTRATAEADRPTTSPLENKPAEVVPEAAAPVDTSEQIAARTALESFLAAPTWQERAKFTQQADSLQAQMQAYYLNHPDGPVQAESIEYLLDQPTPDCKSEFYLFQLKVAGQAAFPCSVEQVEGKWKVDWACFVEFKDLLLPRYFDKYTADAATFRVVIKRTHYFGTDVPNQAGKHCYSVEPPVAGHSHYVWVDKDNTELLSELGDRADFGFTSYPVVKLSWVKEGEASYVVLDKLVADNWRGDRYIGQELSKKAQLRTAPLLKQHPDEPFLAKLVDRLEQATIERETSAQRYGPKHPRMIQAEQKERELVKEVLASCQTLESAPKPPVANKPTRMEQVESKLQAVKSELAALKKSAEAGEDRAQEIKALEPVAWKLTQAYYAEKYSRSIKANASNAATLEKIRDEVEAELKTLTAVNPGEPELEILKDIKRDVLEAFYEAKYALTTDEEPADPDDALEDGAEAILKKFPENKSLWESLSKWREAKTQVVQLQQSGFGNKHPQLLAAQALKATLRKDIERLWAQADSNKQESPITVGGEVRTPGEVPFRPGLNLYPALLKRGGPTEFSDLKNVKLLRGKKEQSFDLRKITFENNPELQPGDIIVVPAGTATGKSEDASKSTTGPPKDADLPFGAPVAGKPGFVYSPYAPDQGMVDVEDLPSGTKVECPYTKKVFRVPDAAALARAPKAGRFTVLGEVSKPGAFNFPAGQQVSLLEAIGMAGGYTKHANTKKISVRRSGQAEPMEVDTNKDEKGKEFQIQPGDVIMVREAVF